MSLAYETSASHTPNVGLPPFPVRRWSIEQYMRMASSGVLDEDDNVELLEGWIVAKMTKNPLHDSTIDQIDYTLSPLLPSGWYLRIQNSLMTPTSVPEPDLCLVRGNPRDYQQRHPRGEDATLVIEVADTSLERDRLKCRIYAEARVSAYWIVNLVSRQIEVYSAIGARDGECDYRETRIVTLTDSISIAIPDGRPIQISAGNLLP